MSDDEKKDRDPDEPGETEAGSGESAEKLPAAPSEDDDSALGDTDQHSDAQGA